MMPNHSLELKQRCRWHTLACHTVVTMQVHLPHGGYNAGAHLMGQIIIVIYRGTEVDGKKRKEKEKSCL